MRMGCEVPSWYQKWLNTLTLFSETSPERLRLIDKANSSTGEPSVMDDMESDTDGCFALDQAKGCLMLLLPESSPIKSSIAWGSFFRSKNP